MKQNKIKSIYLTLTMGTTILYTFVVYFIHVSHIMSVVLKWHLLLLCAIVPEGRGGVNTLYCIDSQCVPGVKGWVG